MSEGGREGEYIFWTREDDVVAMRDMRLQKGSAAVT